MLSRVLTFVCAIAAGAFAQQSAQEAEDFESGELLEFQADTAVRLSLTESEPAGYKWHQPRHKVTITVSPVWAYLGAADLSVEYRSSPKWGFLLNGMAGEFRYDDPSGLSNTENDLLSVRGQVRRYLWGEGGHVAAEFSRWSVTEKVSPVDDRFVQWRVAALLGHKVVLHSGLTFDIQMGGYYVVVEEDRHPDNGTDFKRVSPILRANVGWSF